VLGVIGVISLIAPLIAPYHPLDAMNGEELLPPSPRHWFGTDLIGRDVFSRTLHGGRQTLVVAVVAVVVAGIPGVLLGLLAGWFGGALDRVTVAFTDALLAIPALLLAMTFLTVTGYGRLQVATAVGLSALPVVTRMVRAAVLTVRGSPFMEATQALGARPRYLLFGTLLPNIAPMVAGIAIVILSWSVLNAATLNFLGFGGDPGVPEWGQMLAEARQAFYVAPWAGIAPGLAITVTLAAINGLIDQRPVDDREWSDERTVE
jgi:peptide/nickel transport system permease protein